MHVLYQTFSGDILLEISSRPWWLVRAKKHGLSIFTSRIIVGHWRYFVIFVAVYGCDLTRSLSPRDATWLYHMLWSKTLRWPWPSDPGTRAAGQPPGWVRPRSVQHGHPISTLGVWCLEDCWRASQPENQWSPRLGAQIGVPRSCQFHRKKPRFTVRSHFSKVQNAAQQAVLLWIGLACTRLQHGSHTVVKVGCIPKRMISDGFSIRRFPKIGLPRILVGLSIINQHFLGILSFQETIPTSNSAKRRGFARSSWTWCSLWTKNPSACASSKTFPWHIHSS